MSGHSFMIDVLIDVLVALGSLILKFVHRSVAAHCYLWLMGSVESSRKE